MRGESKYHYVDLTLLDDHPAAGEAGSGFAAPEVYTEMDHPKG